MRAAVRLARRRDGEVDDVEAAVRRSAPRAAMRRWRNRSRNVWWWPYSSPSVAMTTSGGASSGVAAVQPPGVARSARARTGRRRPSPPARTRPPPTGRRRRTRPRCPAAAELHAVRTPGVEFAGVRLPRREDRVPDARSASAAGSPGRPRSRAATALGRRPKRSRKSRRPQRISVRRSAGEASGRIAWWNGLGHPVAAAIAVAPRRSPRGPAARVAGREPAGERRPEVPRHPAVVAPLGVRAVALRVDARVPVVERRGRGGPSGTAAERVDAQRLVEVPWTTRRPRLTRPGRRSRGACRLLGRAVAGGAHGLATGTAALARGRGAAATTAAGAALVDALEAVLGVRDRLDRAHQASAAGSTVVRRPRRPGRCPGGSRRRRRSCPGRRGPIRSPPTSYHAAGLPPPPSSVRFHSMPSRASSGVGRGVELDGRCRAGGQPVAAERGTPCATRTGWPAPPAAVARRDDLSGRELDDLERLRRGSRRARRLGRRARLRRRGRREEADEPGSPLVGVVDGAGRRGPAP